MKTTPTKTILLTMVALPFVSFQPVSDKPFQSALLEAKSDSCQFRPNFMIVNGNLIEIPFSSEPTSEIETISSLLEIGNILFKDARNETPAELEAMRSYFKSKYKKV
ncbi:MAG: hypothetical protein AABY58_02915 [Nitrospirota bacterium]|jgi:hypothetical protein